MLTSGPILNMEIITIKLRGSNEESFTVQITASKGKKDVFHEEILVSKIDAMRLNRFINKNLSMKISKFPN